MMSQYTLNDFFDAAIESSKELVAMAEEATAKGVKLEAEDIESIEAELKELSAGTLGTGVKKKDVRAALELRALAAKYAESVSEGIEEGATDEVVREYVDANKADYYSAELLKFAMTLKAEDFGDDTVAYVEAQKLVDRYADKLAAATTADEFKRLVIEYEVEKATESLVKANLGSLEMPTEEFMETVKATLVNNLFEGLVNNGNFDSGVTKDATYAEVFETVASKLYATCTGSVANLSTKQAYTASADDAVLAWASNAETKVGDTKVIEAADEKEYSKTAYMMATEMTVDDSETKDVAHILIKAEKDQATAEEKAAAKAKADKLLADFLAGEKTLEKFEELAKDNNEDSSCVYENVFQGQMVSAFDAWTFDESRKTGDTGVVETEFGYHIMYFIGEGKPVYYANAIESYINDEYAKVVEELTEKHVTVNEKAVAKDTDDTTKA